MEYNKEKFDDLINKIDDNSTVGIVTLGTVNGNATINMNTDLKSGDGLFIMMIQIDHICGKLLYEVSHGIIDQEDGDEKRTADEMEEDALKIQKVLENDKGLLIYVHLENADVKGDVLLSDKETLKQLRNKGGNIIIVLDGVSVGGKVKLYNDEANKLDFCKEEKSCPKPYCPPQNVCEEDDDTMYIVIIICLIIIIIALAAGIGYMVNKKK